MRAKTFGLSSLFKISGCLLILFLCATFIGLIPSILSSKWGNEKLIALLNQRIAGHIEIESLKLAWNGPQIIQGVRLKDAEGKEIIAMDKAIASGSIIHLIRHGVPSEFNIINLNLELVSDLSGNTNLEQALRAPAPGAPGAQTSVKQKQLPPISMKNVYVNVNLNKIEAPLMIRIKGQTEQAGAIGTFTFEALSQGLSASELIHTSQNYKGLWDSGLKIDAEIKNLPVPLLDQLVSYRFPELAGKISDLLGSSLNVSIKQSSDKNGSSILFRGDTANLTLGADVNLSDHLVKIQLQSNRAQVSEIVLELNQRLTLKQPVTISLALPAHLMNQLLPAPMKVGSGAQIACTLQEFSAPHPSTSTLSIDHADLIADMAVTPFQLTHIPALSSLSVDKLHLHLNAKPLARPKCSLQAILRDNPIKRGLFSQVLGENAELNLETEFALSTDAPPLLELLKLQFESEQLHLSVEGQIDEDLLYFETLPTHISYLLKPDTLQALGLSNAPYQIDAHAPVRVTIAPLQIPVNGLEIVNLHLSGDVALPEMILQRKNPNSAAAIQGLSDTVALHDLNGRWLLDGELGTLNMRFSGMTRFGKNQAEGTISATLNVNNLLDGQRLSWEKAGVEGQLTTHKIPTALINDLLALEDFIPLLGASLDTECAFKLALHPEYKGNLTLNLESEYLSGGGEFLLDKTIRLAKERPADFRLTLTPNGYNSLRKMLGSSQPPRFALEQPSEIRLTLNALQLPITAADLLSSSIAAHLTIDRITALDKKAMHKITLENIQGDLNSANILKQLSYHASGKGSTSLYGKTSWEIQGALNQGFLPDGSLNKKQLSFNLESSIKTLPVAFISELCCLDPSYEQKIDALFGPTLDVNVTANISTPMQKMAGPLFLRLQGTNAHLNIDAMLDNGVALLNKDLILHLKVTPELGQYVLQDILPITEGILSADQPLKLTIPHQGVVLPIQPLSISSMSIPKASLELGKVYFSPKSQLAKVLSIFLTPREKFQVWMAPAFFSLSNGTVQLERVDLLINQHYPVATWGNVELTKSKVNMVIGLSGAALIKAFNLTNIPRNYMLQIPFKGPLNNPSIDKAKATARISSLVAQSQGGAHGLVLGTVLDIASGSLTEGTVPEPASRLPWAEMLEEPSDDAKANTPADSDSEHPLRQTIDEIGKNAGTLIKKIFK